MLELIVRGDRQGLLDYGAASIHRSPGVNTFASRFSLDAGSGFAAAPERSVLVSRWAQAEAGACFSAETAGAAAPPGVQVRPAPA